MPPTGESTLPAARRARKSIGIHTDARKATDKENATIDLGAASKSSRSKSLGPGGLDALKQSSGNRRASLAVPTKLPRSILKPTVSPLPEIPPMKKRNSATSSARSSSSSKDESSGSKIAVRTEEEQQAAAREREERERRDARRKSLANRRVSFAAEATLHTFHEIDFNQESTASTGSTRRESAANNSANTAHADSDDDDASSLIYSSDSEPADVVEEIDSDEEEIDSNSDSDDGTMMTMVTEEVTGTSIGSIRSDHSGAESSTLDEALRLASQRAGNQSLGEEDEDQDEDEDEEVIPSFGWIKKNNQQAPNPQPVVPAQQSNYSPDKNDEETNMDMDITGAVGGILSSPMKFNDEDMSMEVTRMLGGIIGQNNNPEMDSSPVKDVSSPMQEATMDLTTAIGGIRHPSDDDDTLSDDGNEDMSMELTTVMGGVLGKSARQSVGPSRRRTVNQAMTDDDVTMDMTTSIGGIVLEGNKSNNDFADETQGMDMTMPVGGIISSKEAIGVAHSDDSSSEVNNANQSPSRGAVTIASSGSPKRQRSPAKDSRNEILTEHDPGLWAFQGKGIRRSMGSSLAAAPEPTPQRHTPSPDKVATPRSKSKSPKRAPPPSTQRITRSASRSASPEKSPSPDKVASTPSPAKTKKRASIFTQADDNGVKTPTVVLTPQRRLSGLGADRSGIGSPRVASLFERRGSLSDASVDFVPGKRLVSFQDPQEMSEEVDREREREGDKENGRAVLEQEVNGPQEDKDATFNLRDMIDSLSPKRKPLQGRKSLHVGSANGLLGKRPAELTSDEEEEEEQDGVKRLKGHQGSPVKKIRLKNPPPSVETTGHLMKSRLGLDQSRNASTPTLSSPQKATLTETPKHQLRFKDVDDEPTTREVNFSESPVKDAAQLDREADDGRIQLQDFLNMTSIRFMELTTTKRRHTAAPSAFKNGTTLDDDDDDMSLERCVVSGACTVPMLELYQHSCRELKKYISEGRRIVKEIESDTFEENPPLFQEYMSATPDVKALMDNQFKNVKTYARLLSKAMWYEWRMKLQEGLREGLVKISHGMDSDYTLLQKQQDLISSVLPSLVSRHQELLEQSSNLEEAARELADSDPAELKSARDELSGLDSDIAQKKKLIAQLRQEYEQADADVTNLTSRKELCLADIRQSEEIREECRGWTIAEVDAIKDRVDAIERESGWAVTGISGTTLSMTYKREIELVFDIESFQNGDRNSTIDLWYIAESHSPQASSKTDEKEFFLQCIRDHIRALPHDQAGMSEMLQIVGAGWDMARNVTARIQHTNISFPTKVVKTSDSTVALISSVMLVPVQTRVEITLNLLGRNGSGGIDIGISPEAKVVYGERFNIGKIGEFLATRIGDSVTLDGEEWSDIIIELKERLIARGRKSMGRIE